MICCSIIKVMYQKIKIMYHKIKVMYRKIKYMYCKNEVMYRMHKIRVMYCRLESCTVRPKGRIRDIMASWRWCILATVVTAPPWNRGTGPPPAPDPAKLALFIFTLHAIYGVEHPAANMAAYVPGSSLYTWVCVQCWVCRSTVGWLEWGYGWGGGVECAGL